MFNDTATMPMTTINRAIAKTKKVERYNVNLQQIF